MTTETFSTYMAGLPAASTPLTTETTIVLQGGIAKSAANSAINSTITGNVTLTSALAANKILYSDGSKVQAATVSTGLSFVAGVLTAPLFTSTTQGEVNLSGGGTTNFLRADGNWAAPPNTPPGGATNTVQYNAGGGSFGGMAGTSWDNTNRALTMTGATVTTSNPILNMTQTWSAGGVTFTGILLNITNTASAAASKLFDFQIGSASVFGLKQSSGAPILDTAASTLQINVNTTNELDFGVTNAGAWTVIPGSSGGQIFAGRFTGINGNVAIEDNNSRLLLASGSYITWTNSSLGAVIDTTLSRYGVGIMGLSKAAGAGATAIQVYNTVDSLTSPTNYERGIVDWTTTANLFTIGTQKGGSGTARNLFLTVPTGSTSINFGAAALAYLMFDINSGAFALANGSSSTYLGFSSSNSFTPGTITGVDVGAARNAAGTLGIFRANSLTNPAVFQVYNTIDTISSPTNYERGVLDWVTVASTLIVGTQKGGSGATRAMNLVTGGTSAITISTAQLVALPAITADTGHTDSTVCQDTTSHALYSGTGAAGICLGTSSIRHKHNIQELDEGLTQVMALRPITYRYNWQPDKDLYGFTAEEVVDVIPRLVGMNDLGQPNSVDMVGMLAVVVNAIKEQQIMIEEIRANAVQS